MTKRVLNAAKVLLPFVVAFFIGRVIYRNWQHVREAEWELAPGYLFVSFVLTACWFTVRPLVWCTLLKRFGYPIPFRSAYLVVRRAELSRYVPGTIWQYISRVYLAGRYGVPAAVCMAATFLETVLLILASLGPAMWNLETLLPDLARFQRILLVAIPVGAAVLVHPRVLNLWARVLSRALKQPYREMKVPWSTIALLWAIYLGVWVLHGLGAGVFVKGVMAIPLDRVPVMASYYALAWLVAMVSVIAPAGMGIRDGVLGLLLSQLMPVGVAFTVAVAVRLWMTVLELFWAVLARGPLPPVSREPEEVGAGARLR